MARKPRLQFAGAIYHVINRGNYRRDLFETADRARAFSDCLFEVAARLGWRLHAYALMRNHFHLALETPQPNLVEGMHWLQGTFATRFNRFRSERGHLFQSRYQAILVEEGRSLARLVNYIHLNPVRAGIVPVAQLEHFRWSSLRAFVSGQRPACLVCSDWLREMGLVDDAEGWKAYLASLVALHGDPEEQERQGFSTMNEGWAIGTEGWRQAVAKDYAALSLPRADVALDPELKHERWRAELERLLKRAGRSDDDLRSSRKGEPWKIELARELRRNSSATNAWIARNLRMGTASSVSVYLSRARDAQPGIRV